MIHFDSQLKDKQHIIWDWNGTLLNDVDAVLETIHILLREHSLEEISRERYLEKFRFPIIEYYRNLGFDFSKVSFETLSIRFIEEYLQRVLHCELHLGARELLEKIQEQGITQSVLSASQEEPLKHQLKHFKIDHFFDNIYGLSDHYGMSKIARGKELMQKTHIPAAQTLLIGDTDHDLEVGTELGIDVILLTGGHQSPDRLRALHPRVLDRI